MTEPPIQLHIQSWALCPIAQRVLIAAHLRGQPVSRQITSGGEPQSTIIEPTILTLRRPAKVPQVLTDGLSMLELIEDLFPEYPLHPADPGARASHRNLMALCAEAQNRLSRATRERDHTALDMALGALQAQLARLETALAASGLGPDVGLSNLDIAAAPTLWRLTLLDQHANSHLLAGFPRLRHWAAQLSAQEAVAKILNPEAADLYLVILHARRARIVDADVSLAWAPISGPEIGLRGAG